MHINAGVAGGVLALIIGRRVGFRRDPMKPHNLTLTMIGAGLLWFGWYGFNVGSIVFTAASTSDAAKFSAQFMTETGVTFMNTTVATMAAMLGLAADGADPARQGHLARRGLGRRRRPGRDHPVLRRGQHPRARSRSAPSPARPVPTPSA